MAIDWGTSSIRAYRLDVPGQVLDLHSAAAGRLACGGRFEALLAEQVAGWGDATIVMAGMIDRNAWLEVPYTDGPAGLGEIAASTRSVTAATRRSRAIACVSC